MAAAAPARTGLPSRELEPAGGRDGNQEKLERTVGEDEWGRGTLDFDFR